MAKLIWFALFGGILIWSGINPKDQLTWFLETLPAMLGGILLLFTYRSFTLTPLLYILILIHCIILMIGGHYTYAEVPYTHLPILNSLHEYFEIERNNYDKLGHFVQGFVPAILAREILIRKNVVNGKAWLILIIISVCLAFSAFYEMIEWWVALLSGEDATAFLATQGYIWDTQSDMALALIGAISALLLLSKLHDNQLIEQLES